MTGWKDDYKARIRCDLYDYHDNPKPLDTKNLFYPWQKTDKTIRLPIESITHKDKLIEDLLNLGYQGTYGDVVLVTDGGDYIRLAMNLEGEGIIVRKGKITYLDKPHIITKSKEVI